MILKISSIKLSRVDHIDTNASKSDWCGFWLFYWYSSVVGCDSLVISMPSELSWWFSLCDFADIIICNMCSRLISTQHAIQSWAIVCSSASRQSAHVCEVFRDLCNEFDTRRKFTSVACQTDKSKRRSKENIGSPRVTSRRQSFVFIIKKYSWWKISSEKENLKSPCWFTQSLRWCFRALITNTKSPPTRALFAQEIFSLSLSHRMSKENIFTIYGKSIGVTRSLPFSA